MKRTVFITGLTLAAVAVTGVAAIAAPDGKARHHMSFQDIDTDGDGKITQSEMQGIAAARFATADVDGDGFLTLTELEKSGQERAKRRAGYMLERMDADGDGKIALSEMKPRRDPARIFERLDADGDGVITLAEYDAAHEKRPWRKKMQQD